MFEWRLWQIKCRCLQTTWNQCNEKKILKRRRAAKNNPDKVENENKSINSEIAYLKKLNIKIFLLDHIFLISLCEIIFRPKYVFSYLK